MTDTPKNRPELETLLEVAASTGLGSYILEGIEDAGLTVTLPIDIRKLSRNIASRIEKNKDILNASNRHQCLGDCATIELEEAMLAANPFKEST